MTMNIYGRITAALASSLVMLFFCGCNKDTAEPVQSDTSETTSSRQEYSADEIRALSEDELHGLGLRAEQATDPRG